MQKKTFFILYFIFGLAIVTLASMNYFTTAKTLWWFACLLSGAISSVISVFYIRSKVSEEDFVNYMIAVLLLMSFCISFGLALYQGGQENLPIVITGINTFIWLIYAIFWKKLK